jgi:hypothetical protein
MEPVIDAPEDYCRQIEAYLCRKNDGHLIRIVGPAFEQVCAWARRGVPLRVAFHGIDRYFERYYAKGPRRRPVRVEFCEADVLDAFDEWRRAVGPLPPERPGVGNGGGEPAGPPGRRHASLPAHLDRTIARLTSRRAGAGAPLDAALAACVRELDAARQTVKSLRGEARQAFVERLSQLDAMLLDAARKASDSEALTVLAAEADEELAPYRDRMSTDAYRQSQRACLDRLIRERYGLPVIAYE